jgi:hypothetical protein
MTSSMPWSGTLAKCRPRPSMSPAKHRRRGRRRADEPQRRAQARSELVARQQRRVLVGERGDDAE